MKPTVDQSRRLAEIGRQPDAHIDVAEAALILAAVGRTDMEESAEPYRRHLGRLADEVGAYAGSSAADDLGLCAEALNQVIARRYGYGGNDATYDELDSANLMRVIDRRHGLPVVLGVVYIDVARRLGWSAAGLNFPAHFLIRLERGGRRQVIDPYNGGRSLGPREMRALLKAMAGEDAELTPEFSADVGNRDVLVRIQNNIKLRLLKQERMEEALDCIETMLLFAPDTVPLWREAGLLNARLDKLKAAVAALEEYLRHPGGDEARFRASALLQELRARLN